MRRPAVIATVSATCLIALGIPFFTQVKFTSVDASALPTSASARQVNDALNTQFPPNRGAPLDVVVGAPAGSPRSRHSRRSSTAFPTCPPSSRHSPRDRACR